MKLYQIYYRGKHEVPWTVMLAPFHLWDDGMLTLNKLKDEHPSLIWHLAEVQLPDEVETPAEATARLGAFQ